MIRLITTLVIVLFTFINHALAQDISTPLNTDFTGDWFGQLNVQGTKLKVNFHVTETGEVFTATMDSPDQGAMGIPTTKTIINDNTIEISMDNMQINYIGELKGTTIDGVFKQAGMEFPLKLTKDKLVALKDKVRPQDPKKPYNYKEIEVVFENNKSKGVKLAGTLTLPNEVENPPVAILISGSGPQNRNEELMNHRPFLVIADYLTNNGIAVLRYDDRGTAKSTGKFSEATNKDFATDVEAAIKFLQERKDIDSKKIGLIGHSEGGLIAPMVAANNKDIAFIILMAGPGVKGTEVLLTQSKRSLELANMDNDYISFNTKISKHIFELVNEINDEKELKEKMTKYLKSMKNEAPENFAKEMNDPFIKSQVKAVSSPWMRAFLKSNPDEYLSKVTCPVLAINGEKDFQVIADLNLSGIEKSLIKAKNKDITIKNFKNLNHLFQTCETGAVTEYSQIEETIAPEVLETMFGWLKFRFLK